MISFCIRPRQGGKTHQSLLWLEQHPGSRLLVPTAGEMQRLQRESGVRSSLGRRIDVFGSDRQGQHVESWGIDNLDLMMYRLTGLREPVEWVTATGTTA